MHSTSKTLLIRLQTSPQEEDWSRFVKLYTPLLFYWAKKSGLSGDAAEDLVQELFFALMGQLARFEHRGAGSFRAWLRTIARNKCLEHFRKEQAKFATVGGSQVLGQLVAPERDDVFWEIEYQHRLVARMLDLMKSDFEEKTWRACWMRVVEDRSVADVAAELGLTEGAVYAYASRVLRRLREEFGEFLD